MFFVAMDRDHSLRTAAEEQISEVYYREYGAVLREFPNTLVALHDKDGEIVCAAGLRFAEDSFFSERYLQGAVESILSDIWKRPVTREQVAEVTCLAGRKAGMSLILIQHIVKMCRARGIAWAFFTATDRLRATLRRTGVPVLDVAPTDIRKVPNPSDWGTYYATDPRVVAIHDDMVLLGSRSNRAEGTAALA